MTTKQIAKIISYLFIPPIMNLIIFLLFANQFEQVNKLFIVIISSVVFGVILPITTFIILRKKGKVINDDATIKEERTIPYIYGITFSLLATSLLYFGNASSASVLLWFSYLVNSTILIIINKYWKISAHTMGVAIPLGASFSISGAYPVIFGIILFVVAWARFELKVHTILQLLAGAFVGFSITYILLNFI